VFTTRNISVNQALPAADNALGPCTAAELQSATASAIARLVVRVEQILAADYTRHLPTANEAAKYPELDARHRAGWGVDRSDACQDRSITCVELAAHGVHIPAARRWVPRYEANRRSPLTSISCMLVATPGAHRR
jgi:hypothetical protein